MQNSERMIFDKIKKGQETKFLLLILKGEHRYMFFFGKNDKKYLFKELSKYVMNDEFNLDWHDIIEILAKMFKIK